MSNQTTTHHVKMTTADPSGIGLFGLAMVTLVASSQKLGLTDGVSLVLPWAIFLEDLHKSLLAFTMQSITIHSVQQHSVHTVYFG